MPCLTVFSGRESNFGLYAILVFSLIGYQILNNLDLRMRITLAKFLLLICFSILTILMPEISSAQKFSIRNFTTRDGLAHNDVRAVSLDSLGFLWIATWDGLSRYDGYTFKNYFHDPDDSLSLPYFSIYDLKVDGGDNLWLLTDQRTIAVYDRSEDNFKKIETLYGGLPENLSGLSVDESGFAWFAGAYKLYRFDFKNNKFDIYDIQDNNGNPKEFNIDCSISVYEDKIFMATESVVAEFERSRGNKLILSHEYPIDSKHPQFIDFNFAVWLRIYLSETGRKCFCIAG